MARNLSEKAKDEGQGGLARCVVKLDSLAAVRTEMARIYRLSLTKKLKADEATKYVYMLKEIRACIEAELVPAALADIQRRLDALTANAGVNRGRY